jgi:hypothetical protein
MTETQGWWIVVELGVIALVFLITLLAGGGLPWRRQ